MNIIKRSLSLWLFSLSLNAQQIQVPEPVLDTDARQESFYTLSNLQIFASHSPEIFESLLNSEPVQIPIPVRNADMGFSKPFPTDLHVKALEASVNKNVLEIGPGHGYFMGKLLAANAKHVTGVEKTKEVCKQIPLTIKNYEDLLKSSYSDRYIVHEKDFLDFKPAKNRKYDVIVAFNIFHYLTPKEAEKAIKKMYHLLADRGKVFLSMNAPSGNKEVVNAYRKQVKDHEKYPGYIMTTRTDVQEYSVDERGEPLRLLRKVKTLITGASAISSSSDISPSRLELVNFENKGIKDHVLTMHVHQKQTSFRWGRNTALNMLDKTDFHITEMYYEDGKLIKNVDLSDSELEKADHNLVVVVGKGRTEL